MSIIKNINCILQYTTVKIIKTNFKQNLKYVKFSFNCAYLWPISPVADNVNLAHNLPISFFNVCSRTKKLPTSEMYLLVHTQHK